MCELCKPKRETEWIDKLPAGFDFNVFRCKNPNCPDKNCFMIVSKHHGPWEPHERKLVEMLRDILFPGKGIRWEMISIADHAHCHIIGT